MWKMKPLSVFSLLVYALFFTGTALSSVPKDKITDAMNKEIHPLTSKTGWKPYIDSHPHLFSDDKIQTQPYVSTEDLKVNIDGKNYVIGIGARSIYIEATPKTVVSIVDTPRFFQALFGLDKPADIYPVVAGSPYQARLFKLVPGIETQDFTLSYVGNWEDDTWVGTATLVKDEKDFALRTNVKIVEPKGTGSIYREVALFYPLRWWMNLMHGTVQSITRKELTQLNKSIKYASEKVQKGAPMSDDIGKSCFAEASK
jgi:hypothetical protein